MSMPILASVMKDKKAAWNVVARFHPGLQNYYCAIYTT